MDKRIISKVAIMRRKGLYSFLHNDLTVLR
jgi:hypothetical protein